MRPVQRLLPIYLIIFFGYIGYSLIITIFTPLFLYPKQGILPEGASDELRYLALGLVIFLYPFGQFLSSPVLGALSDRFGRKKVLVLSMAISTMVYACIGFGIWLGSFLTIATSLLVAGLSEGNVTIAQSTIADIAPKRERGRLFGYISLSVALSYLFGPLLGGKLAAFPRGSHFAYATPFFAVSVLLLGNLCWLLFGFQETLASHKRVEISYWEAFTNLKNLFYMRRLRYLFFVNFLLYLSLFGFFQSFPIYIVSKFKVDVWTLSLFIAWSSFPFLFVNLWLTGYLTRKFSAWHITAYSALWTSFFLLILVVPQEKEALWVTLFLVGIGAAACLPAIITLLSTSAQDHEQGRVLGINQSMQFFAEAFSGLAIGFMAAIYIKLALILFAILSLLGAFLLLAKRSSIKTHLL